MARESVDPGMDMDVVEENVDVDLKQLIATLWRDERLEIKDSHAAKYRRERSNSIRVIVS